MQKPLPPNPQTQSRPLKFTGSERETTDIPYDDRWLRVENVSIHVTMMPRQTILSHNDPYGPLDYLEPTIYAPEDLFWIKRLSGPRPERDTCHIVLDVAKCDYLGFLGTSSNLDNPGFIVVLNEIKNLKGFRTVRVEIKGGFSKTNGNWHSMRLVPEDYEFLRQALQPSLGPSTFWKASSRTTFHGHSGLEFHPLSYTRGVSPHVPEMKFFKDVESSFDFWSRTESLCDAWNEHLTKNESFWCDKYYKEQALRREKEKEEKKERKKRKQILGKRKRRARAK